MVGLDVRFDAGDRADWRVRFAVAHQRVRCDLLRLRRGAFRRVLLALLLHHRRGQYSQHLPDRLALQPAASLGRLHPSHHLHDRRLRRDRDLPLSLRPFQARRHPRLHLLHPRLRLCGADCAHRDVSRLRFDGIITRPRARPICKAWALHPC